MKSLWRKIFPILGIIAGLYVTYNLVLGYIEGNKMEIVAFNKAPMDHDLGFNMQFKLPNAKYLKIYRYKAEGPIPSTFDENKYLAEYPQDAVYIANANGKDGDPWLVIFADKIPRGHGLVYKRK